MPYVSEDDRAQIPGDDRLYIPMNSGMRVGTDEYITVFPEGGGLVRVLKFGDFTLITAGELRNEST